MIDYPAQMRSGQTLDTIASADGTPIAFRAGGMGPSLLFVHGSLASRTDWAFVARLMRKSYTVVTMDRRGRGGSGTGSELYSLDREAEDIAAVVDATKARGVVAHSFGAVCTLQALDQGLNLDAVVLYEPPIAPSGRAAAGLKRACAEIADGRAASAVEDFLEAAGATSEERALIRASPAWDELATYAPTLEREMPALTGWEVPAGPFELPTLLLLGEETTSELYLGGLPHLRSAFAHLTTRRIGGQRHLAHVMAPDVFAASVETFLADTGGVGEA